MTKHNPNEGDVKKAIKKILDRHKLFWWMPPMNGFGKSGVSDFVGLRAGVFFAIEAKYDIQKNPPTPLQLGFLSSIQGEDGYAFVVDKDRLEELDEFLTLFFEAANAAQKGEAENAERSARLIDLIRFLAQEVV